MYLIALTSDEVTNRRLERACAQCVTGRYGLPFGVLRGTERSRALGFKRGRQVGSGEGWVLYREPPFEPGEPDPSVVLDCLKRAEESPE